MNEFKYIGKPIPRKDALKKVTGEAVFGADIFLPRQIHAAVYRSPYAHAELLSVDTEEARKMPGVRLVLTGRESPLYFGQFICDQPILAIDRVRYHGEPVALIVADSLEEAKQAAGKIKADYKPLEPVRDLDDALCENPALVHEDWKRYKWSSAAKPILGTNICDRFHLQNGDPDMAFKSADIVVENTYETAMLQHVTMETHAATALYNHDGLTVWTPAQSPFMLQNQLAGVFGLPVNKVRLITTEIGGAFGNKYELRAEPLVALAAAKFPGRPIKLVFERHEEFTATGVRAPCRVNIRTAADKNGFLIAQDTQIFWDTGAYVTTGPRVNYNAGYGACTPYKIPNMRIDGYCVMSNKPLGTAFRGFGATEVAWAYENQMDAIAAKLNIDAVEFRLKNLLDDGDVSACGERVISVGTKDCLKAVAASIGWDKKTKPIIRGGKLRGKGVACFSKITGTPSNSSVIIKLNTDSTITILIGGKEMGQGVETILPQIVAESLGVPVETVNIAPVDTLYSPFEKTTTGSRLTFHVGNAALGAVSDMKKQIEILAAEYWKTDAANISVEGGIIRENGGNNRSLHVSELGGSPLMHEQKPVIGRCSLSTLDVFDPPDAETGISKRPAAMWFWGAQAAEVEVDMKTGRVRVLKMAAAHDVGKAINPMNCMQQIEGSVIMGIGSALSEEMIFDDKAKLLNGNLVDFKIPTSMDANVQLEITLIEKPHPEGPFGAKGVWEPGMVPTAAAIGNAVANAAGIRLKRLPLKPEDILIAKDGLDQC